jgi:ribosomal protein L29
MIQKEEKERKAELAALRTEIRNLRGNLASTSTAVPGGSSDFLEQRVKMLESQLQGIQSTSETKAMAEQLGTLMGELKKALQEVKTSPATGPVKPPAVFPSMKVGILAQMQGQAAQEQQTAAQSSDPKNSRHWQRQLSLRRLRVLVGGSLSPSTSFFFESEAPNIGRVAGTGTKATTVSMYVQDAQIQHTIAPELSVIAGLQVVGFTRNGLQSAATLMAMNFGSYQFIPSGPLDNSVGRDLGVNARGFLFDERLEYRAGVFSGKNLNLYSPLRTTFRLQYNFRDREKGFFYGGTTLGKSELLSLGGGIDVQGSYRAFALDGVADVPLFGSDPVTLSTGVLFLDGGGSDQDSTFFTGQIARQTVLFAELGYLFKELHLQPYLKYESQSVHATVLKQVAATAATLDLQNALRSSHRIGGGVNWFLDGHGATVKLLVEQVFTNRLRLDRTSWERASSTEITMQFQYFTY